MSHSSSKLLILLSLFCNFVLSQTTTVTLTPQTQANAIIGLDRKNWNGGSTALHSQGYAHDFTLPASPGPCFKITSIRVLVDVNAPIVNNAPGCDHTELYYNLYQNNTYSGGATANFFKERRANPGVDFTTTTYTCTDPLWNSNFGGTFSVDVIPVYTTTCPNGQNAINAGFVAYTYTITLTVTYGEVTCAGTGCLAPSASTPAGCGNLAPTATVIQPTCLTGGSITVNPGPSGPTYAYAWSGGLPSTRTPTNVPPDTYTVTVTRTGTSCSGTTSVTLNPPSPISVIATPTPTTCGLNNGSITVSPGPTGHTYAWSPSASTAKDRTGLGPGPYTVTVTQTSTGCKGTSSVTVDPSTGFLATATRINPTCGLSNGSIQVNTLPTGLGYTYSWTGSLSGDNPQNLGSGTYTVTVTQTSTGCTRSVTSLLSLQSGALAVIDSIKQPNCGQNNGSILLTQTIGRTFSWTNGLTGNNPQNLAPGTYTVTVTQTSTGCTKIIPYTLNPSSPLAVTTTKTDPACGQNNGSILVSTGPTGYVYSWTGGLTGHNPTNLAAGTYIVTVTPTSGGCMEIDTVVLNNINPTSAPLFDPIPPICQGIIITLPTTSKDSISGVWTPPFNTNVATLYTFKPDSIKFPCAIDTNMMILVIPPSKPTISVFAPICQLDSSFSLNTTQTGITGIWSGSGVANNRFDPNPGGPGNFKLIFTPDTNQCADSASTLITVFPAALLPNPSLGAACVLSPAITLPDSIGNVPGTWTFNTSPIKIFDPKVLGEGSYILKFNPKAGYCAFPVDVPLAVKPFNAGADSTNVICALNNQTLNLNSWLSMGHSQGGIWRINQDTISNPAAFDLKNLSAGTVRFRYILSDPACGIDTAEITMIVSVPNNAGQDSIYTICQGATALLNLSDLTKNPDTGGNWSQISGTSVNLSDSTKVNISGLSGSQNIFRYIVPADVCPADTSLITVSVTPFLTAGTDQTATFCSGSQVNLLSQINTSNNTGSFLNVNNTPGLSGTIWNTSAIPAGNYRFQYIITNAAPCKNDTAYLQFIVTSSITAGQDKLDTKFCDGETLNLASYLSANATSGGQFYQNSTIIPNGTFPTGAPLNYTMYYVVGDSISCPRDTAFFTFSKIVKPLATLSGLSDLCENLCQKITINNNATTGSNIFLTTTTSAGQQYSLTTKVTGTSPDSINICTKNTGPFDFNNLPVNQSITITLDSIALSGTGCTFNYSPSITFFTKPLLRRQISRSLCQGEVFIVGKDVYSETRPSGNTVIPSAIPGTCDSIIAVQLNYFSPSPVTPVIRTSCDPNFSLTVGNTIFDKNNPSGQVRLQNIRGCDSLVTVSLTFSTFAASNFSPRTCDTTVQFTVGNQTFNKANPSGTVTFTGGSISGCDSIVTVSVTYLNTPVNQIQRDLCDDSFTLTVGTTTFSKANPAGLVKLAGRAANGCDSLVNVKLNYKTLSPVTPVIRTVCDQNFRLTVGSTIFDKNNPKGQVRLQNTQSCDSLVDVNLTFSTTTTFSFTRRTCDTTEQFNVGTQTFNKANPSGMVTFTGGSISGCDSIVTVSVTYLNTPVTQIQRDLCDDSFTLTVGTTTFSKANPVGLVKLAGRAANGCDSLVNVKLNYKTLSPVTPVIRTVCDQNFRLTVGSTVFDKNNPKGQVRLQNTQGCDSLVDVNLTFSNAATSIFNPRTCDTTEQFKVGTQTFSRGNPVGTVTLTGANAQGCDSIVTVAITYLFAATSKVEQQLCNDAFTLTVGTTTFSKANPEGTVKLIGKAANGCDSILSVKLTYLAKGVQNFSKSTCLSEFTFVVGGATFSKTNPSGSVTLAGRAANGCDSIVNVQLIYSTFKATQVLQDICDGTMPQIIISQPSHPGPYDILVDNVRIPAVTSMPYNIKIDSGQHKIIISNPDGCKDSATYNVNFVPDLTVSLTQDATINGSTKISVNAPANGIWDLKWTPAATLSCNDCREPVAKTAVTTTYFLDYKYGNNCMGQKEITIKRAETRPVLPNILSHNSSGNNNIFYVTMPDQLEATVDIMDIFDRWGNVVFSARNVPANQPAAGWDGTIKNGTVMTGVYVYFVRVTTVITGESEDFSGSITVIR